MAINNRYTVCAICGAPGHLTKSCPLYRLNEQQAVRSGKPIEALELKPCSGRN